MSTEWEKQFQEQLKDYQATQADLKRVEAEKAKQIKLLQEAQNKAILDLLNATEVTQKLEIVQQTVFGGKGNIEDVLTDCKFNINYIKKHNYYYDVLKPGKYDEESHNTDDWETVSDTKHEVMTIPSEGKLIGKALDLKRNDKSGSVDSLFIGCAYNQNFSYLRFGLSYASMSGLSFTIKKLRQIQGEQFMHKHVIELFDRYTFEFSYLRTRNDVLYPSVQTQMQAAGFKEQMETVLEQGVFPIVQAHFLQRGRLAHRYV